MRCRSLTVFISLVALVHQSPAVAQAPRERVDTEIVNQIKEKPEGKGQSAGDEGKGHGKDKP